MLALGALTACSDEPTKTGITALAQRCGLDSECSNGLKCVFEYCRIECNNSSDCKDPGAHCVRSDKDDTIRVCQLETEVKCTRNSNCKGDQVCAEDGQCRDECKLTSECGETQSCVVDLGVCADSKELRNGKLIIDDEDAGVIPMSTSKPVARPSATIDYPDADVIDNRPPPGKPRDGVLCDGNQSAATKAQFEALLAKNCKEITGSLSLSGTEITSLKGLETLELVQGSLAINNADALTELSGLDWVKRLRRPRRGRGRRRDSVEPRSYQSGRHGSGAGYQRKFHDF
jgi:hypothetical protein